MAKSNFEKMRLRYQHLGAPGSEPSMAEFNRELKNDLLIPKLSDYHALKQFLLAEVRLIEEKEFGDRDIENSYFTTKVKIISSGFRLKIFHLLERSCHYIEVKDHISSIAINRLILEHQVMFLYFTDLLESHVNDERQLDFMVMLDAFVRGNRLVFVDLIRSDPNKKNQPKKLSSKNVHVNDAFKHVEKIYFEAFGSVKQFNDALADSCHVTPTSTTRMLYRQKYWNKPEPIMNWSNVRLSTISNSNEKFAFSSFEQIYEVYLPIVLKRYKEFFVDSIRSIDQFSVEIDNKLQVNADFRSRWIKYQEDSDEAAKLRLEHVTGKKMSDTKNE